MIQRHSLVWLKSRKDAAWGDAAQKWQSKGYPFMVCRTRPGEELSLGFCPLPLENRGSSPERIAVPAAPADIERIARPPEVREISRQLNLAPNEYAAFEKAPQGCTVRLIGSHLWEVLTGARYSRKGSDLDVVVDLKDASLANAVAEFLASISERLSIPLDGELSFPGSGEVSWKEWLSGSQQVLIKAIDRVELVDRSKFQPSPRAHEPA